ncbi:MAG TPA: hypothetical protein VF369_01550 [candidate division Zixibacteria bacterium]
MAPEKEKPEPKLKGKEEVTAAKEAEAISDEELTGIIGATFGDYAQIATLLPSFKTLEGELIRGIEWLDPKKTFQREQFLTKPEFAPGREQLSLRLKAWRETLAADKAIDQLRRDLDQQVEKLEANLTQNLKKVHMEARDLEMIYRAIDAFFMNAKQEPDEPINVYFSNLSVEELVNPDDRSKFEELGKDVGDLFKEFSVRDCYSICVIPGFLGDAAKIDLIARQLGLPNKLHIVTDFPNLESFEETLDLLEDPTYANLAGTAEHKQYISVCANWILARARNQYEDDELWVPPSSAVAGMIYRHDSEVGISQPSAGYKYGEISEAQWVRFRVNQPAASKLLEKSVVSVTNWDGKVRAMGDATLFSGETFNIYSIRRTYDYIYKTLRNYLNKQVFLKVDDKFLETLRKDITQFMEQITKGDVPILEKYQLKVFADEEMRRKQEVDVMVVLNPHYPVRTFNIKLKTWKDDKNMVNVKDVG